jgi:hypothetical protein
LRVLGYACILDYCVFVFNRFYFEVGFSMGLMEIHDIFF